MESTHDLSVPTMNPSTPPASSEDRLSKLIPEMLVEIISHVPSIDYLSLVHTNQFLRNFLRANGSQICNKIVRDRFSIASQTLPSTLTQGWLVPTHPVFLSSEDKFVKQILTPVSWPSRGYRFGTATSTEMSASGQITMRLTRVRTTVGASGSPRNSFDLKIKLSGPGPQFLHFLETYGEHVCVQLVCWVEIEPQSTRTKRAAIQGNQALQEEWRQLAYIHYLRGFFKSANGISRDTTCYNRLTRAPRVGAGLIWYYGCQ